MKRPKRSSSFLFLSLLIAIILGVAACGSTPPAAKPSAAPSAKPSTKATPGPTKTPPPPPKKSLPAEKKLPVPADWETMADEVKGYQFQVPQGTQGESQTVNGIDIYIAKVPEPAKIGVIVLAFKDKTTSKEDLLEGSKAFLEGIGEKDIKIGKITEISGDYSLAEVTSTDEKGAKTKGKVLVATDVTDNYVMFVLSPEADFGTNEKIIDEIWGSFGMSSGGFTGES